MNAMKGRTTMKKKIRIFALLLVVAMLLSAFAYAHEETDSAKIHLTGETLSEADDVQAIGNRAILFLRRIRLPALMTRNKNMLQSTCQNTRLNLLYHIRTKAS